METLRVGRISSFLESDHCFRFVTNHEIRRDRGAMVRDFPELVERVAQLAFFNPESILLYRGQSRDCRNRLGNTSIKPTIFRTSIGSAKAAAELNARYETLSRAEKLLSAAFAASRFAGRQRIVRHRLLRWAILQHYEVCGTPLLDVTQSLRVAASFATNECCGEQPVIYVLAVPSLSGSITASSVQGLQTIRLNSICPPDARRPYFQEGYLLGEYPDLATMGDNISYRGYELDFGRRLLAKFRLDASEFWTREYTAIPKGALYPNERDPLVALTDAIRRDLDN